MYGRGWLDWGESHQRHPCRIAAKHHELHVGLHGARGHVPSCQHNGGCDCQPGADQRRVRIGEWHDGIVCTFGQPLLNRHGVDRGRFGPVDMELWRFERRYQR